MNEPLINGAELLIILDTLAVSTAFQGTRYGFGYTAQARLDLYNRIAGRMASIKITVATDVPQGRSAPADAGDRADAFQSETKG